MHFVDNSLKFTFEQYNDYRGGGTEFYYRCIYELIEPYLQSLNINYNILSQLEIDDINRTERERIQQQKIINQLKIAKYMQDLHNNNTIVTIIPHNDAPNGALPNEQQQYILNIITSFYILHNIGKIIWACGIGKALLSIFIVSQLNFKTIVIGVPSNNLQKQMKNEILKLFPNKNNILFIGGNTEYEIKTTTNEKHVKLFLNNKTNNNPKFIITTYHSCHLLVNIDFIFDFKIGDEAHHLVGIESNNDKNFRLFHNIKTVKTLFMTATEKIIETIEDNKYSMNDELIFGKCIDIKTIYWAIENKKITDYNILVLKNTENEVDAIINSLHIMVSNKELFISTFMCLKSFIKYIDFTHILLYTNNMNDAELAKQYINDILKSNILPFTTQQLYNNALHSKNCNNIETELKLFRQSKYGIISCVYMFGEGFNEPKLNGVCVASNMFSETRITQYLLRPNRLEHNNPNKKAYIIIPYIDSDNWDIEHKSYEQIRIIIAHMRNVDKHIEQKIIVSTFEKKDNINTKLTNILYENYEFTENSLELNKIKLRLRYSKSLSSNFSEEQDEYNYVKSINKDLNIQSKTEYYLCDTTHCNFINNPDDYFKTKGVWVGWYDFMGSDTTNFIQSKEEWIQFCKEKHIASLSDYNECCKLYSILPKEPADYYKHFTNILSELNIHPSRR